MSTLTVTIIQTNLYWEQKADNLQMFEAKINSITERTELVILPEMFSTGFSMKPDMLADTMDGETIGWMKRISAQKRIIITGSVIIKEGEHYYNRLIWMLPNGQYGMYDKRHLFAYANEHQHYTGGNRRLIASAKGWKINLQVCYDLRFPVWARQSSSGTEAGDLEYDVLVYVANWPEKRSLMWRTLLQARAIENQSYCIGVNRVGNDGNGIYHSGDSMVISPLGEVLYHKAHDEDVFTITLNKGDLQTVREKMPFWKDADPFVIIQD
jgi:predicted amidohydrolase